MAFDGKFEFLKEYELGGGYGSRHVVGGRGGRCPRRPATRARAGGKCIQIRLPGKPIFILLPPGARAAGSSASDGGAGGVPGRVRAGVRRAVHRRRQRVHRLQGEGRGRAALRLPLEAAQAVAGPQQARCSKMHRSESRTYTRPPGPTYTPLHLSP